MNNKNAGYLQYYSIIADLKKVLRKEGSYYFHLGKGDIDRYFFPTPKCLLEKVKGALDLQYYKYSHPLGRKDTRNLLAFYHNLLSGTKNYSSNNIALLISATSGLNAVVKVLKEQINLKKALITKPSYINYRSVFESLGVEMIKMETSRADNFNIDCKDFISTLDKRKDVKLVLLCNPNFPFGRFLEKDCFKTIIDYCEKNNIYLLLDNVFESSAFKNIDLRNHITSEFHSPFLIRVYNYSKDLGVAGFRIGYLLTSESINAELADEIDVTYGSPQTVFEPFIDCNTLLKILSAFGYQAYSEGMSLIEEPEKKIILKDCDKDVEEYIKTLNNNFFGYFSNSLTVSKILGKSDLFDIVEPQGGFNMGIGIKTNAVSMDLFKEIFLNTGVVLTPGEVFDMPKTEYPWFRITLANGSSNLETALERVYDYIQNKRG